MVSELPIVFKRTRQTYRAAVANLAAAAGGGGRDWRLYDARGMNRPFSTMHD